MTDTATDPPAHAVTTDPAGPDLRQEFLALMRACTPKQRKWLRQVGSMAGQTTSAAVKLGYSTHTCWKWLRMPHIRRVLALQEELAQQDSEFTQQRTRREIGWLAHSSIGRFYDENNQFKPPSEWTEEMSAAVEAIEFHKARDGGGIKKIKLHNKPTPLTLQGRIQGLIVEKHTHELSGPDGGPIEHADRTRKALEDTTDPNKAAALYGELIAGEPGKG
jgi:hypothetical protein